jgi:hypothetical protein
MILAGVDHKLDTILKGVIPASLVLRSDKTEVSLSKYLEEAREVSFCGATLSTTIRHHRDEFARLARKGHSFRFLIVNPEAFPDEREEKMLFKKTALIEFNKLLNEAPAGKVEVRLLDRYPSNKITIIDYKQPEKDMILVEMFGYQTSKTDRPFFILLESLDYHWFRFYKDMYEGMWEDARPFTGLTKPAATA